MNFSVPLESDLKDLISLVDTLLTLICQRCCFYDNIMEVGQQLHHHLDLKILFYFKFCENELNLT